MVSNNSVNILEVCRVNPLPSSLASATPSSLPLTFFDILWLRFPPVERVFFYETPPTNATFLNSIVPKLKHSLSLTLQTFLPLGGNIIWPPESHKPIISYKEGDAVSLTVAESNANFYHLSGNNFVEAVEYHPLVPDLATSHEHAPVLALQVTMFSNCGFCIGITAHHTVLDGKSLTMFRKLWAHLCKLGGNALSLVPELIPSFDRMVIKDPAGIEAIYLNQLADARPRLEPPMPDNYFGNCLTGCAAIAERNDLLGEKGVAVAVKAISEAIKSLDYGVLKGAENWLSLLLNVKKDNISDGVPEIAGSPRFELYNTDFGWGKPVKVELISIDKIGGICVSDSRDGTGGIEIGLFLKKREMEVFASVFAKGLEVL
ncbi:hypothetical protein ACB092_01G228500 [Castanea dentata]